MNIVEVITFKSVIRRQYVYQQLVFLQDLCRVSKTVFPQIDEILMRNICTPLIADLFCGRDRMVPVQSVLITTKVRCSNSTHIPVMVKCARYNIM